MFINRKGDITMKVNLEIKPEYTETFAVIYAERVTDEIRQIMDIFSQETSPIVAQHSEELIILKPDDIYMVRVEDGNTMIYGGNEVYYSRKRLYELKAQLGTKFMQISKCSLVNLKYLSSVEPGFSGTLLLKLKNGSKEYVSRKYLSDFKHYLGL